MENNAFRISSPYSHVSEEGTNYLRCTFRMEKKGDTEKKFPMWNLNLKLTCLLQQ